MEQISSKTTRSKHFATWLSVLVLVAIVAVAPHAFAQQAPSSSGQGQQNGIPLGSAYTSNAVAAPSESGPVPTSGMYNDSDDPHGPLQMAAWAAGIAIFVVMSGVGIFTTARKH